MLKPFRKLEIITSILIYEANYQSLGGSARSNYNKHNIGQIDNVKRDLGWDNVYCCRLRQPTLSAILRSIDEDKESMRVEASGGLFSSMDV